MGRLERPDLQISGEALPSTVPDIAEMLALHGNGKGARKEDGGAQPTALTYAGVEQTCGAGPTMLASKGLRLGIAIGMEQGGEVRLPQVQ